MPPLATVATNEDSNTEAEIAEESFLGECCNCTLSVTNLSTTYKTLVTLYPEFANCSNPLDFAEILDPGQKKTKSGMAYTEGSTVGQPNIFVMLASNQLGYEDDCVRLRVEIDCGQSKYDKRFKTVQHLPFNYYHVAQFGYDAEGNLSCSFDPLNLSYECRVSPETCHHTCEIPDDSNG